MKQGILTSWNSIRGFGTVVISRHEAYFLHTTNVVEGPDNPTRGSVVYFDVAPAINDGKLPQAVNAVIVEPVAGGAR
jgi:cold shock CspA family protein